MPPMQSPPPPPPLHVAWFVWALAALLYLAGFFQRVAPAVMTSELMHDFQIGAGALGNLSAYYFYSYVAMQVPTGIMADTWGPRRLLSTGAGVAALGTMLFAVAPTAMWAGIGRMLIGGSVAVAFVGMLKLANNWFPPSYFALVSGAALCCGMLGAVVAGTPLRLIMDHYSWRWVMLAASLVTAGVGAVMWLVVRDYPSQKGYADWVVPAGGGSASSHQGVLAGIAMVFRYRNTWLLFLVPGAAVGCVLNFAGLWGVPYLTTHYGLTTTRAAAITSALMVAVAMGGLLFGWMSDRWGRRKPPFVVGFSIALACWTVALAVPSIPLWIFVVALLLGGLNCGCIIISFALAKESVPQYLAGTISGVVNMGIMMGPMVLQPAMGWVLDRKWQGAVQDGIRLYGIDAYRAGFTMVLAWMAVAWILLWFTRETHCRQGG